MPGAHRHNDSRFCGATTISSGTVRVNGRAWAVEGDPNTHGGGELISVYGSTVRIGGKKVICAVGDKAGGDNALHPIPPTDPSTSSKNVWVYEGKDGKVT
jgi:uncharacterized Zn-binding protein involved in type VI secretion